MKRLLTSLALVVGLGATAAIADSSTASTVDFGSLSAEQLESLTNILAGLPRQ